MQRSSPAAARHGAGLALPSHPLSPGDSLWSGVVRDIGAVLDSASPPGAKLSAIAKHLRDWSPGQPPSVPHGSSPEQVAALIGGQLALGDHPATHVFGALLLREIRFDPAGPGFLRPAEAAEVKTLGLRDGDGELYIREGTLCAGSIPCARVTLKLAYQRVCMLTSGSTWGLIRTGTPAGTALSPYGLRPGHRRIEVIPGANPVVKSWRVSTIRTMPVLIATEDVTEYLCQYLASRAV